MRMAPKDTAQYPQLARFVTESLASLPEKSPEVFKTFCRFSHLQPEQARQVLRLSSTDPEARVLLRVALIQDTGDNHHHEHALFLETCPNQLFLPASTAFAFERMCNRTEGQRPAPNNPGSGISQTKQLMEAVILRALVHWGNYKRNIARGQRETKRVDRRAGHNFEMAAYGKIHSHPLSH